MPRWTDATRQPDGTLLVRCRESFELTGSWTPQTPIVREAPAEVPGPDEDGDNDEQPAETPGPDEAERGTLVHGTASSTSLDSYGTEMSAACLESMAAQLTAGVALVHTHAKSEWDGVIGQTLQASLQPGVVADPADPGEQGWLLRIDARLIDEDEVAEELMRRLARGEPIGLSIGGWFRSLRLVEDAQGYIERIIVEEVELDHVAVTRRPANPDCKDLRLFAAELQSATAGRSAPEADNPDAPPVGEPPPASVPDERAAPPLDGGGLPCDDTARTADASTIGAAATDPSEGVMPEDLRAAMAEALAPLVERLDKLERSAPAAAPAPVPPAADEWKARAERAEATVARLVERPQRRIQRAGLAVQPDDPKDLRTHLATRCREEGHDHLAAVAEHQLADLDSLPKDPGAARSVLQGALRSLFVAAEEDGIIRDPAVASWGA